MRLDKRPSKASAALVWGARFGPTSVGIGWVGILRLHKVFAEVSHGAQVILKAETIAVG